MSPSIPVFLFAVICSCTNAVPPPPPTNDALLYSDGSGVLQDNHLLTPSEVTDTIGVSCVGGNGLSNISWILPNGVVLMNGETTLHSNVKLEMTDSLTAKILAAGTGPVSPTGAYTCRAGFTNGAVQLKRVWILNNITSNLVPIINPDQSSCSYVGTDIQNGTHGILLTLGVQQGPPSNIECKINNQILRPSSIMSSVQNRVSPATRLSIVVPIPFGIMNPLTCTVGNSVGTSSFTCTLQSTSETIEITRTDRSSRNATITWSGGSSSSSYNVIVESTDGSDFIQFKDISIIGRMATIRGLHPPLAYTVTVTASSAGISSANTVTLPSVSEREAISAQQCSPRSNSEVTLELKSYRTGDAVFSCSSLTIQQAEELVVQAITNSQEIEGNCTYSNVQRSCSVRGTPKGTKTPRTKTKTKTKTKTNKRSKTYLTIEAQVNCGGCNEQAVTEGTPRKPGTPRTPGTPRGGTPAGGTPRGGTPRGGTPRGGTPRRGTPKRRRGKRAQRKRQASKERIELTIGGQSFTGYLRRSTVQSLCGSRATVLRSHTGTRTNTGGTGLCDCPTQCYTNINRGYQCLAM